MKGAVRMVDARGRYPVYRIVVILYGIAALVSLTAILVSVLTMMGVYL